VSQRDPDESAEMEFGTLWQYPILKICFLAPTNKSLYFGANGLAERLSRRVLQIIVSGGDLRCVVAKNLFRQT
jgi:hypothetical protein